MFWKIKKYTEEDMQKMYFFGIEQAEEILKQKDGCIKKLGPAYFTLILSPFINYIRNEKK